MRKSSIQSFFAVDGDAIVPLNSRKYILHFDRRMHVFGVGDTLPEINAEESHLRPLISILQECRCAVPWYRPYVHGIERLCQVAQICIEQGLEVVDISPRKNHTYSEISVITAYPDVNNGTPS